MQLIYAFNEHLQVELNYNWKNYTLAELNSNNPQQPLVL